MSSQIHAEYPISMVIQRSAAIIALIFFVSHLKLLVMKKRVWIILVAFVLLVIGIVLQFTNGNMLSAGDYSMNYFAAGDFACGVFAAGKFSVGIFSVGIFSLGIFSLGIFNIGLYAIGLFVLAWKKRLPDTILEFLKSSGK
jgi:hypothetical protein